MSTPRRACSVLTVSDAGVWTELAARFDLDAHTVEVIDPVRRVVDDAFERDVLPDLRDEILVRYARRDAAEEEAVREDLAHRVQDLRSDVREVLFAAQRHALDDGVVFGVHAWDPEHDGPAVRALVGAELLYPVTGEADPAAPYAGRYRLNPDLPPPPDVDYDFEEAVMDETDDLSEPTPGPMDLLHDLAALAAAMHRVRPRRTATGTVSKSDVKKLGKHLAVQALIDGAALEDHPRWGRALRALEALHMVAMDPLERTLQLDLGLERTLSGDTVDAADRFVHRLLDRDLHVVLPAVRAALRQAGDGAVDEMIFVELLGEQHREVIFPRWLRQGHAVYPLLDGTVRPFDEDGWERIEGRMVHRALQRCQRLGLIRRADGVFAATADGRRWSGAPTLPPPPVWVTSDLEVMVPPDGITAWERFQLERLARCLARDTVDRFRLEREGLAHWLRTHDVEEAVALLSRRALAVPGTVTEALRLWAASAERIVLTRGVLR